MNDDPTSPLNDDVSGEPPCAEGRLPEPGASSESSPPEGSSFDGRPGGVTAEELQNWMNELPPELLAPDLPVVLASMVAALEDQALRHLGITMNPITRQVETDIPKAKIAIDVMAFITQQVSPLVADTQRRDLQNKVATLQLNYVQRKG